MPHLPFVVLGTVDEAGDVWATLRANHPGFMIAPDPYHLNVRLPPQLGDPAENGLKDGDAVALLGIDLHTKRRNRLNGILHRQSDKDFVIAVEHAFGNCPKYIQRRDITFVRDPELPGLDLAVLFDRLEETDAELVQHSDTLFVSSYMVDAEGHRHVDVSHRGGRAGFVNLDDTGVLTIPDFAGNHYFNTLGNLLVNPRAGLAFVDFSTGGLLQMIGSVEVLSGSSELSAYPGAERLWRFRPRQIIRRSEALPLRGNVSPD
jgi:predicted pyridoxine 5'-phosphate oxidase superfamily flavin-nucleotide-binding protein